MKRFTSILVTCLIILGLAVSPSAAGKIDFSGTTEFDISVALNTNDVYRGSYTVAAVGNYLAYSHANPAVQAVNWGGSSASVATTDMTAANSYAAGKYTTQAALHGLVNGFLSQFSVNRLDLYFYLTGGTYTFTVNVPTWQRTYGWDQTVGLDLVEAGWYSNLYAKLVHQDNISQTPVIEKEINLVVVNHFENTFPGLQGLQSLSGSNASLTLEDVTIPAGYYTLYLADYMTQYGVTVVPLPSTLLLLGSGLLALVSRMRRPSRR